ncbi:Trypsin [Corynebacterium caspium DSM 44850]|nr:Trypsin [Corynebacterium caspium DSM 44850]
MFLSLIKTRTIAVFTAFALGISLTQVPAHAAPTSTTPLQLTALFEENSSSPDYHEAVANAVAKAAQDAASNMLNTAELELQSSSTVPVFDPNIARLITASESGIGICTANYIGNNFWLTAHHCLTGLKVPAGILAHPDGSITGLANAYIVDNNFDLALLKAKPGPYTQKFDLPKQDLQVGQEAEFNGFAGAHDYASNAKLKIVSPLGTNYPSGHKYVGQFKAYNIGTSVTCHGDSGSGVFIGNTIYGIVSGTSVKECRDGYLASTVFTSVHLVRDLISTALEQYRTMQPFEEANIQANERDIPAYRQYSNAIPTPLDPAKSIRAKTAPEKAAPDTGSNTGGNAGSNARETPSTSNKAGLIGGLIALFIAILGIGAAAFLGMPHLNIRAFGR